MYLINVKKYNFCYYSVLWDLLNACIRGGVYLKNILEIPALIKRTIKKELGNAIVCLRERKSWSIKSSIFKPYKFNCKKMFDYIFFEQPKGTVNH